MNKFVAILSHRCPRCREGRLFETGVFSFSKPFHMPGFCSACKQNYYPEPAFYYGSMFISYIITAFYCLGFMGVCILLFDISVEGAFGLLAVTLLILYVWFFRTARSVWIHINVRYDADAIEKAKGMPDPTEMPGYVERNF